MSVKDVGAVVADDWLDAMELDEIWDGEMVAVDVGGQSVLLVNLEGEVRAYENRCPHQAWRLDDGDFDGERIVCSRHMWEFDPKSGAGVNPADCSLKSFECRVGDDGIIRVRVP